MRTQAWKQILAIDELGAGLAGQRLQLADKVARWNVDGLRHAALCGYRHRQRTGHGKDGGAEQSSLAHRCISPRSAPPRGRISTVTHDRCRSEEHTSELQSLMRISYAVFCLKKKKQTI